jgi:hypothetical protein
MCLTPCSVAIEFSILRATSVSSCAGDAPAAARDDDRRQVDVREVLDLHRLEAHQADQREHDEEQHAGIGLRMHQAETLIFMGLTCSATAAGASLAARGDDAHRSPSARKRRRDATTRAVASQPEVISMRSPTRRPTATLAR